MKNLLNRLFSETPEFQRKLRNFSLVLVGVLSSVLLNCDLSYQVKSYIETAIYILGGIGVGAQFAKPQDELGEVEEGEDK